MCGIVGIVSLEGKPVRLEELHTMCAAIVHRGPDEDGFYLGQVAGLGMRRLSIIDLQTGRQPIASEDGAVWVVFNGEIYNYRQLRADLERRGHRFSTDSDTETIVHLYEERGERCLDELRGMFAFALWDDRRQTLLLARDRLGIKPLYYAEAGGRLLFASELKAILQLSDVERRLDWAAMNHLFTFLSTPATGSIIEGVRKLEPGHFLTASPGQPLRIRRYWDVEFRPDHRLREPDLVEQLRALVEESVSIHLASDVPVGAFLSGGVDSGAVLAFMARHSPSRIKTFSIGFQESDYNELEFARLLAKQFGTEHYELVLEPDVWEILEDLPWYLDEPFGDSSAIPTWFVSKLAAQYVKVVLSGDGGDELFAGYDKYVVESRERAMPPLPPLLRWLLRKCGTLLPEGMKGRNLLRHRALVGPERYLDASTLFRSDQKRRLFQQDSFEMLSASDPWQTEIPFLAGANGDWLSALQSWDIRSYLPLDILTKVDRMSMAHSLEVRPPLLDHKLVEFAATIPPELLLRDGATKFIFKRAMEGILPPAILDRPKRGFAIPLRHWFRGKLEGFVRDLLLSGRCRQRGLFRPDYIEKLLQLHQKGKDLDLHLWTLISFEMWCRTFLDAAVPKVLRPPEQRRGPALVAEQSRTPRTLSGERRTA